MTKIADDLLRRASAAQRLAMERALAEIDLTPAQFATMEWLQQEPGLSGADIAKRERITPPTCSVVVSNLERKGLVTRRLRERRGRAQHLELSPLGHEKVSAGAKVVEGVRGRLVAGLDPRLRDGVLDWLEWLMNVDV